MPRWEQVDTVLLDLDGTLLAMRGALEPGTRPRPGRLMPVTPAHPHRIQVTDAQLNLQRRFDAVSSTREVGAAREQAEFWSRLAAARPFEAEPALLVDDSLPVLRAARGHGVGHLWAVRRPGSREPCRPAGEFDSVEPVHQPALTLADCGGPAQG